MTFWKKFSFRRCFFFSHPFFSLHLTQGGSRIEISNFSIPIGKKWRLFWARQDCWLSGRAASVLFKKMGSDPCWANKMMKTNENNGSEYTPSPSLALMPSIIGTDSAMSIEGLLWHGSISQSSRLYRTPQFLVLKHSENSTRPRHLTRIRQQADMNH